LGLRAILITLFLVAGSGGIAAAGLAGHAAPDTTRATSPSADTTHHEPVILQDLLNRADTLIAQQGGSRAENARIYLTWDAPYGMPRASRIHRPRAHDPMAVDTLWLCFLPGRTSKGFLGFGADLYFRAAEGDTLGPWWHMEGAGQNKGELTMDFGPDASFPQAQPWAVGGFGGAKMYRTAASARVNINFAVPYTDAVPVNPDSVYTLCRVLLHHHRVLPGCSQPVCVEWSKATLVYWLKDDPTVNRGERFVSYASDASVCDSYLPINVTRPDSLPPPHPAPQRSHPHSPKPPPKSAYGVINQPDAHHQFRP